MLRSAERSNLYGFGPSFHCKDWAGSIKQHSLGIAAQQQLADRGPAPQSDHDEVGFSASRLF